MNQEIINEISEQLAIKNKQVEAVLKLLQEGNTELTDLRTRLNDNLAMYYPID